MSSPIQYGDHGSMGLRGSCNVCGIHGGALKVDHCHQHGWVREVLCNRCNTLMALIDRRITPHPRKTNKGAVHRLLMHFNLCPDCSPLTIDDLSETRSWTIDEPRSPHAELRLLDQPVAGLWSVARIAQEYGWTSATARKFVSRYGLKHKALEGRRDARLYDPVEVRAAKARMPGRGHNHPKEQA